MFDSFRVSVASLIFSNPELVSFIVNIDGWSIITGFSVSAEMSIIGVEPIVIDTNSCFSLISPPSSSNVMDSGILYVPDSVFARDFISNVIVSSSFVFKDNIDFSVLVIGANGTKVRSNFALIFFVLVLPLLTMVNSSIVFLPCSVISGIVFIFDKIISELLDFIVIGIVSVS